MFPCELYIMAQTKGIGIIPLILGIWFSGNKGAQLFSQITSSASLFTVQGLITILVFISSLCAIAIGIGILLEWGSFAPSEERSQGVLLSLGGVAVVLFGIGFYL